jgi:two-component sensor histidine kinase
MAMVIEALPQSSSTPDVASYTYHPPSEDKESWQRLNLWISSTFYSTAVYGMELDSSLLYVSRSLGLSRLPLIAEGFDDPELYAESKWFDEGNPGKGASQLSKLTGKKRLQQLLLLLGYYVFQPKSYFVYKDSIDLYLIQAALESKALKEMNLRRQMLCLMVKMTGQVGDTTSGNIVFNKLMKECDSLGDKRTKARAYFYRGLYTAYPVADFNNGLEPLIMKKIGYLEKAREIYLELKDAEGQINALTSIGQFYLAISKFPAAQKSLTEALELQNSIGYPYTHYTTDNIAMAGSVQGKFGEPLKYSLETIKAAEKTRDSIGWGSFYSRLGGLYYTEGGREEESLKWLLKSIDRYIITNDAGLYADLASIVNIMNEKPGREKEALDLVLRVSKKVAAIDSNDRIFYHIAFAGAYLGVKQYKLAEQHGLSADSIQRLAIYTSVNSAFQKTMIDNFLGALYYATGEYAKSKRYFEQYFSDSSRAAAVANDMSVYEQLIRLDSVFHDDASAVDHYKKYVLLLDSNFRASKVRQAEELQVMYLTEEKENQITLLNAKAKLEHANLKQARFVKNVTIGGIILVLIIAILLYRQTRLKQKSNNIITHKNELLEHLVTEKEWLLKEIHHRVKNNFQTVMGLLGTQSGYLKNDVAITAINDSQRRIQAMSLIHQRLYQSNNLSAINMPDYIHELVDTLSDSFNTSNHIRFNLDIEPVKLDLAHCIPLGLILNEAITNSFKYAFPDNREGVISILLKSAPNDQLVLTIQDDGIGLPSTFNINKSDSMGMNLMRGLSEEIGANFTIHNQIGTKVEVSFTNDPDITSGISELSTVTTQAV